MCPDAEAAEALRQLKRDAETHPLGLTTSVCVVRCHLGLSAALWYHTLAQHPRTAP